MRPAEYWGYWHSQNGFSPGGKAAELSIVSKAADPQNVKTGSHALKVTIENAQYWEELGFGRNDVFYPVSQERSLESVGSGRGAILNQA